MRAALRDCGYFSPIQQDKLMSLLPDSGEECRVVRHKDHDYFIVDKKGYNIYTFHICSCAGTFLKLNGAHQILIEYKAFDLFLRGTLKRISIKTHVMYDMCRDKFGLFEENNLFAYSCRFGNDSYMYDLSKFSEYKQKLISEVFKENYSIECFRVLRLIADTDDFKFEFSINDHHYYNWNTDGTISFIFSNNRSTVYKVVNNQLVKVEKPMEKKPETKKFLSGEELAARHIANLRKYMLKHKDNNVITLPTVYKTETARDWLHRLCASRGFEMMTEDSKTLILTFTGESDGKNNPEFAEFATAEARSQIYISNMEETIARHTADENCENSFTVNSYGYTKSSTFLKWLDNHCKEYSRTYSIDHSKYDVTITFFN